MKIEVLCSIDSGRFDKGDIADLPKDEANRLIEKGLANKVGMATKPNEPREINQIVPKRIKKPTKKEKVNE
jgi:hypothetical protein